ncbi:helix-turn-helix domain-containing protein [Pseudoroseicyclus sp. CXY001]|uniref:helix-turn-helix domain-containing protein n=1 Tax=Pseudoroseicyclus sp. CXY001 TaxID=3242492 RepID=UPI00357156B2
MSNIANIRKLRGLKQADLADLVGVTQPHISRIEGGDDGIPLRLYRDIATALGVELADLFTEERSTTERLLLDAFRRLPKDMQASWGAMAQAVVDQNSPKT